MLRFRGERAEEGAAIVEFIMALPLFLLVIGFIIETGHLILAYAAVDDAAYAVAHAYASEYSTLPDPNSPNAPKKTESEVVNIVKQSTVLQNATLGENLIVTFETSDDTPVGYTHHLPTRSNSDMSDPSVWHEDHTYYYQDVDVTVTYKLEPATFIGQLWVGMSGSPIEVSATSSSVIDRTSQVSGDGWWAKS